VSRIVSIASGKGGVGKTSFAINLSSAIAHQGHSVCLIDADLGLANIDVALNLSPQLTLEDVVFQKASLPEIALKVSPCLDIIPGASGIPALATLSQDQRKRLIEGFKALQPYDFIIIDNSPGIAPSVLSFCLASREVVLIMTPDKTSLTDGYALLKSLKDNGLEFPPFLVLNRARGQRGTKATWTRINNACRKFLNLPVLFLGAVPESPDFRLELEHHRPIVDLDPDHQVAHCFQTIAARLQNRPRKNLFAVKPEDFWEKALIQVRTRIAPQPAPPRGQPEKPLRYSAAQDPESLLDQVLSDLDTLLGLPSTWWANLGNGPQLLRELATRTESLQSRVIDSAFQMEKHPIPVGFIATDPHIRDMLVDVLNTPEYSALDLLEEPGRVEQSHTVIYCMDRDKSHPEEILNRLKTVPVIILAGFGTAPDALYLRRRLNIVSTIRPPFRIDEIYAALQDLSGQGAVEAM
jgi:flagellar biosynthesis protein FlhG